VIPTTESPSLYYLLAFGTGHDGLSDGDFLNCMFFQVEQLVGDGWYSFLLLIRYAVQVISNLLFQVLVNSNRGYMGKHANITPGLAWGIFNRKCSICLAVLHHLVHYHATVLADITGVLSPDSCGGADALLPV
jgi:hypothetical protein